MTTHHDRSARPLTFPGPHAANTRYPQKSYRAPSRYKRRAPDIEGVHASIEDVIGLRRFSLRGLTLVTGEFLLAGLCHNLLLLSRLP